MEIEFKVRITPDELRQQLYASIGFACGFILLFILIGQYFKPNLSLFIALGCVVGGLAFRPYLKVREQSIHPDRFKISHHSLIYFIKDKKALSIPIASIEKVEYDQGMLVFLKRPISERIEIVSPKLLAKKRRGDFYFEWFEPKAFYLIQAELNDIMHSNQTH